GLSGTPARGEDERGRREDRENEGGLSHEAREGTRRPGGASTRHEPQRGGATRGAFRKSSTASPHSAIPWLQKWACPSSCVVPCGGKTFARFGLFAAVASSESARVGVVSKSFSAWTKKIGTFTSRAAARRRFCSASERAHDIAPPAKSTAARKSAEASAT